MHALQLPTSSDTSCHLFSTSLLYEFTVQQAVKHQQLTQKIHVTCIFETPHAMSSMLPLRSDVPVFPFCIFFFTSSDICSWSNGRPHQSNILDLGNRLSVRVSRWIPSKWWKFHTSWSMLRRAYLGGLVARAYFERCQVSTSGKYDMGMIHSQVIRYLRVSALTAKK